MVVSGQLHGPAALPAGWAPEPVWTRWWEEKFLAPTGTRTPPEGKNYTGPIQTKIEFVREAFIDTSIKFHWSPSIVSDMKHVDGRADGLTDEFAHLYKHHNKY